MYRRLQVKTMMQSPFLHSEICLLQNCALHMIETERLILRPWRETDAEDLFRYASDVRVSEMALWPCHTSVEMSREVIRKFFIPNDANFAMICKETGEAIGCIGLVPVGDEHYSATGGQREVGYWIGYPHWGRGLTTEALRALLTYCSSRLEIDSLLLTTDARNRGSQRVAEKCGFVQFDRYVLDGIDSLAYHIQLPSTTIRACDENDYPQLLDIWERAVRATHDFLTEDIIGEIKMALIPNYFPNVYLFCIEVDGTIAGFIGIADDKIEMLFIDDCRRGLGLGTRLINHAIELAAVSVDVNEQNPSALEFYKAKGFHIVSRDERDEAGRPFPILHLSL